MVHKVRLCVIDFSATQSNPEKVVGLLSLIEDLNAKSFRVIHVFDNIFGNFSFIGVGFGTNPNIDNA